MFFPSNTTLSFLCRYMVTLQKGKHDMFSNDQIGKTTHRFKLILYLHYILSIYLLERGKSPVSVFGINLWRYKKNANKIEGDIPASGEYSLGFNLSLGTHFSIGVHFACNYLTMKVQCDLQSIDPFSVSSNLHQLNAC